MFHIFAVQTASNDKSPFQIDAAKTLSVARRMARDESKYLSTEIIKIVDARHGKTTRPDESWQAGKRIS